MNFCMAYSNILQNWESYQIRKLLLVMLEIIQQVNIKE